jgi:D-3-phosphoglycerate dehydrogenase/(S)-sulfolactate dehydrogenase
VWGDAFAELAMEFDVVARPDAWKDGAELGRAVASARAVVVRNRTQVDRSLLEQGSRLEVVARAGVGLDNIDVSAADDLGVVVVAAPGANARSVAEHALGMALALARDLVGHDRRSRSGAWERRPGSELAGRTWGVIGLGATGRAVAGLARAVGMRVRAYDPFLPEGPAGRDGVDQVDEVVGSLPELLAGADVVSLHLALSEASSGMVDRGFLRAMAPGALLINVARGGLVDEDALADALESGDLGGAGLDVRADEPPVTGRIERCERVVLTPHVAGVTTQSQARVVAVLASDLAAVLSGREARHAAGKHRLAGGRPE